MSTDPVRTTCPYCGVGCGVLATPTSSVGDPDHPANLGRLCSKGSALHETLSDATRLLHPTIGGARATWDAALDRVAGVFAETIAEHGPDSVALYVSGQLLTEDYYVANKFAKGFLGTGNIDSNSRLCMSSAVAGHTRAFGEDVVPVSYADMLAASLVVLVGSNTAWCHPVVHQRIVAADIPRIVIDPRRTATCEGAALHLPIRPGSDVLLFNGLLTHLARHVACVRAPGAEAALAAARADAPDAETVARGCDVPLADVETFFEMFARNDRVVTLFSQGVNQSSSGTDKVNAIINAHVLTGRIGVPGAGPFSITGQPNAMGGREVGALSNLLAGHLSPDRAEDRAALAAFWDAPALAPRAGLKAVDLFRAIGDGRVRAVWIMGTNPLVSMPDADAVRRALEGCPFVAVSECAADADTLAVADVALPALAWGERDGTVTNSERVISRQRPFRAAPGEARADWRIVAGVAARMGFGAAFAWDGPHAVFAEHARVTALQTGRARHLDLGAFGAITAAAYDAMPPTRWAADDAALASGARMVAVTHRAPCNPVTDAAPLVLNTGRIRDQWHTMTRTGLSPRLFRHLPEPFVSVHPDDADGIADGALARVTSAHGTAILRARHDGGQRRGEVFVPMHWTRAFAPAGRSNGCVNAVCDPVSGQPELKHTPVALTPFAAGWHAAILVRETLPPELGAWSARWPLGGGAWRHEAAGPGSPSGAFIRLRAAADGPGAWTVLRDPAANAFRAVRVHDGQLAAAVMVGASHALPDREWLSGWLLAENLPPGGARALLAARPAEGGPPDPAICVCFGVGARAILAAHATGAADIAAVGRATSAGTNCGSCRPEIGALIRMAAAQPAPLPSVPERILEPASG